MGSKDGDGSARQRESSDRGFRSYAALEVLEDSQALAYNHSVADRFPSANTRPWFVVLFSELFSVDLSLNTTVVP